MLTVLMWAGVVCLCGGMGFATVAACVWVAAHMDLRMREKFALKEAEQEMHLKALRSASREVE